MTVLMNVRFSIDMLPPDALMSERVKAVFKAVRELYDETVSLPDAYIRDRDPEKINCIFGEEEPEHIILTAEKWNGEVVKEYQRTLAAVMAEHEKTGAMPLDNVLTYEHKKAAMALDNTCHAYGSFATALSRTASYFGATISTTELQEIRANPEDYAVLEVWPD